MVLNTQKTNIFANIYIQCKKWLHNTERMILIKIQERNKKLI